MEVSSEIKEDIRKTQNELRNAIRIHQVWVSRLKENEENSLFKSKVKEAEQAIVEISQTQKLVVERLRRELELYQQRLKAKNKTINIENDNRYVAQQLREYQFQYRNRNRSISLLKPSVLNEIYIKSEQLKETDISDSDTDVKLSNEKENSNHSENDERRNYQVANSVHDSRNNFTNVLNKVKNTFRSALHEHNEWQVQEEEEQGSDSNSTADLDASLSPSPPPLPEHGEAVSQEIFLRFLGLVTPLQKETIQKNKNRRKRPNTSAQNQNDFLCGNFDAKRKKYNQFPYLQTHNDPPQTRSAKLRKQQGQNKSSREGSPSGSSSDNKGWGNGKPSWATNLPAGLSVEPVTSPNKKVCHGCGRNDVPSLLVWCSACGVWQHTGCGGEGGTCGPCGAALPDPHTHLPPAPAPDPHPHHPHRPRHLLHTHLYTDKLAERKKLQERNIQLCIELRKLEARASSLQDNLDEHNSEKRQLLADQIKTQRNIQKLLDFISQFKDTSISLQSTSVSESGSEMSKSNEE